MSMATDPAVLSVEYDCYSHITSLTESGDSSSGHHLYDEVARRLSVQVDAPWGIDRIDTDGERSRLLAPRVSTEPQHTAYVGALIVVAAAGLLPSSLAPGTQAARSTASTMMAT